MSDRRIPIFSFLYGIGYKPPHNTYNFVRNILKNEPFGEKKIAEIKTSDAKLFLIKMQSDGKGYSTVKTVRGVLRPAFQMAVDDDILNKNPFEFQLAGVVVNDSHTRNAITKEQMRQFLKFERILVQNIIVHRHLKCRS